MEKTKVIFRQYADGEVIALFPEIPADQSLYNCLSYMHIGQHGAANCQGVIDDTKPIKLDDIKGQNYINFLYRELRSIGYDLQLMQRYTLKMMIKRNASN